MLNYVYVAVGSAVGGLARLVIGLWLQERLGRWMPHAGAKPFPVGTLLVNASGSLLIGELIVFMARQPDRANAIQYLLVVGLCGGYTTFSTFSADTVALLESGGGGPGGPNLPPPPSGGFAAPLAGGALAPPAARGGGPP